jgi:hypothetical protein
MGDAEPRKGIAILGAPFKSKHLAGWRTAQDAERKQTLLQMRDRLPNASPDLGPGLSRQAPKSFPLAEPSPLSADIESRPTLRMKDVHEGTHICTQRRRYHPRDSTLLRTDNCS